MTRRGGTFGVPAILAMTSFAALVIGLLGDGIVDVAAWIGLALPLVAVWIALSEARRR